MPARSTRRWRRGDGLSDVDQQVAKELAVLRVAYRVEGRAEEPDAVPVEDTGVGEVDREVETGLAAEGGQDAVRPLRLDDAGEDLHGEGLDVDDVGDPLVGHYGGGVGVDEDGGDSLLSEGLARLGPCVVELGGLSDDNGPGADDQHLGGFAKGSQDGLTC